jgi:hypothetical protein
MQGEQMVVVALTDAPGLAPAVGLCHRRAGDLAPERGAAGKGGSMRKLLLALLTLTVLAVASPAAADPPTAMRFEVTFRDVNPCTGLMHTVTIAGTEFIHSHDGRIVVYGQRTITTDPTGFVGHGAGAFLDNGQVFKATNTDILTNPAGDRIRAHGVFVLDLSTETVRVDGFELTCLGPA